MVRQPFERKSLGHLSAPYYHIHISMGDNFETACTALRTNVLAGACKDEKVPSCLQSLPVAVCLSKVPTACVKGFPGSGGRHRLSHKRKQSGRRESAVSRQGANLGRCEQRGWPGDLSARRVPCWKGWSCRPPSSPPALPRVEGGIRVSTGHQLTGLNFKHTKTLLFHVVICAFNVLLN